MIEKKLQPKNNNLDLFVLLIAIALIGSVIVMAGHVSLYRIGLPVMVR